MGGATVIEKYAGTVYVSSNIYGAWWFAALWALFTAVAVYYFISLRIRRASVVALHASFVIILAGALLTHVTSWRGVIHLRKGEAVGTYIAEDNEQAVGNELPFCIRLDDFNIIYHDGTEAAADYRTDFTIIPAGKDNAQKKDDNGRQLKGSVSMNNIYSHNGIRLYQSSYDRDGQGSYLSVNADPWGIPVTYTGYALLFVSLLWMLADPKGTFRRLLRSDMIRKGVLMVAITAAAAACPLVAGAQTQASGMAGKDEGNTPPTLPRETAKRFGRMYMLYNDRVCPVQTFAIDFTKKLCGSKSYKGLTAEQVLTGFILWADEWSGEPIIRLKDGPLRETLQLPAQCSVNTFFNNMMGGYILGPYIQESMEGNNDKLHRDVDVIDEKLQIIMQLRQGAMLRLFPYSDGKIIRWYSPADRLPPAMEPGRKTYIRDILGIMQVAASGGDMARVDETVMKMRKYQMRYGGTSLPSALSVKAERIYNAVPFATILFMLNLSVGILLLITMIYRLGKSWTYRVATLLLAVSGAALTLCLALRWIISGTVPMSNGYETMLLTAWMVMMMSLAVCCRFRIAVPFGLILSGLFLLVSHISLMDPQITRVMPVLSSPLLAIHVSMIMAGFAMLSLTFICSLTALFTTSRAEHLRLMSLLFLYPALAALGLGIFIGAVWANVSWGTYWSWDPKEVWALITFMVYAIAVHGRSVPQMRSPMKYHVFMTLAFLTIIMTCFGVNYFLGGMHSYA